MAISLVYFAQIANLAYHLGFDSALYGHIDCSFSAYLVGILLVSNGMSILNIVFSLKTTHPLHRNRYLKSWLIIYILLSLPVDCILSLTGFALSIRNGFNYKHAIPFYFVSKGLTAHLLACCLGSFEGIGYRSALL